MRTILTSSSDGASKRDELVHTRTIADRAVTALNVAISSRGCSYSSTAGRKSRRRPPWRLSCWDKFTLRPAQCVHKDGVSSDADTLVFSVSSSSIDRIIGTHRNSSYRSIGQRGWALEDQLGDAYVANYFRFLSLDSSPTKAGTKGVQFQLNNTPFPTYKANVIESLADNCYSVDKVGSNSLGMICNSLPAFHKGLYACPLLLAHPTGQIMQAGYDSRGVASQGQWEATGMVMPTASTGTGELATVSSFLIVECTEQLIFSLGREVIHVH